MSEGSSTINDEKLLGLIIQGDHSAFSELVRRNTKKYYSVAYRVLFDREEAEDVVQEAFLKIWKSPDIWQGGKNVKFTTWFYRVVINLCLDLKKKKKTHTIDNYEEVMSHEKLQDGILDDKHTRDIVIKYIQQLPERQQIALNLCFYEGISNKEAAEIMDINIKALQSLIMRAKLNLKEKLKKHY